MTKQDFDKYLDELTSETGFELTKEQKAFAYQAAKEYHNQALRIHDVVGRSEQLKCQCKKARFTRTVDEDFNPLCGRCGKAL